MKQTEIHKETAHRSAFLRFGNGVDRIVHTPSEWVGFIAYLLLIIYIGFAIKANVTMMPSIATTALLVLYIFSAAIGAVAFAIWRGTPRHARRIENSLARIGLTNSAGEVPLLIESREDTTLSKMRAVTVLEFLACGIEQREWEKRKTAIEAALNVQIAKIEECDGKLHICLYIVPATQGLPERLNWRNTMMDYSYPECKVVLGENLLEPMVIDLNIYPHLFIGGGTGSGKTVLLKLILMQLLMKNCVQVTIADFKGGIDFGSIWRKHSNCRMIFTRDELLNYLDTLVDELHRRKEIIAATEGCNNIYEYNNRCAQYLDRIVLAIDEVAEILDKSGLDKTEKEQAVQIERRIATIARLGRAVGIHLVLATQRPDANILSGQIKNNISYRACGRADNVLSTIILDNTSAADEIPSNARGRFIDNEGTVFQSYWFNESAIDWRTSQT